MYVQYSAVWGYSRMAFTNNYYEVYHTVFIYMLNLGLELPKSNSKLKFKRNVTYKLFIKWEGHMFQLFVFRCVKTHISII